MRSLKQKMFTTESKKLVFTAIVIGVLGGTFFAFADEPLPALPGATATPSLTEAYNGNTLPGRDQLSSVVPALPNLPSMNPDVARQQGAQTLQSVNLDEAMDRQNVRSQMSSMSAESSNPGGILPSFGSISSPTGVTTTDTRAGGIGSSGSGRSSSRSDPLGGSSSSGDEAQSSVSRDGSLPAGSLGATGGDPLGLGSLLVSRFSRDAVSSWYNALAAMTALRVQVINRQTQRIADKIDEVNDTHRSLNQNLSDLVSTMNDVLIQLPTIPGS